MRKSLLLAAVAVAALSLSACTTYTEYARTLPQYQPHDTNRCYSNVSVGDGMTAGGLRNALMTLGMGVNDLARLTDVDRRAAARWFSGEAPLPGSIEALLCVMMSERITMDRVFDIVAAMTS